MRKTERFTWAAAARRLNSTLARTLALVIGVVLMMTAGSIGVVLVRSPPNSNLLTSYEVARLLRHLPIAESRTDLHLERRWEMPPATHDARSVLTTRALAAQLHRSPADIRLYLNEYPQRPLPALEAQYRTYAADGGFNPPFIGPFIVGVREADGSWWTLVRPGTTASDWRISSIFWFVIWVTISVPIAWWFARRYAQPIEDFSRTAQRLGRGEIVVPGPLRGSTEIRVAAQSLNDMQARLARYIAERASVIGAIAHDLRAPLSRLNFHLATAPEKLRRNAEAEIREMEKMIAVTLDFVAHETRLPDREPVDLALLVEGVVDNFADMGLDVSVRRTSCATVVGDQLLLKRLFSNLLDNAVKYGGSATVDVERDAAFAIIDVQDAGGGMKPHDIERAFEPFYRAEPSRSRRTGGVGLGLSIAKSVVVTHGGTVELANIEGGLRARVRLPLITDQYSDSAN